MPDLPEEAVREAVAAYTCAWVSGVWRHEELVSVVLEAAAPGIAAQARADERRKFEDLLGAVWLYIGWRYVTKPLTTEQKNLFADAVDAYWSRSDAFEGEESTPVDRWWVDDMPARQTGEDRADS